VQNRDKYCLFEIQNWLCDIRGIQSVANTWQFCVLIYVACSVLCLWVACHISHINLQKYVIYGLMLENGIVSLFVEYPLFFHFDVKFFWCWLTSFFSGEICKNDFVVFCLKWRLHKRIRRWIPVCFSEAAFSSFDDREIGEIQINWGGTGFLL